MDAVGSSRPQTPSNPGVLQVTFRIPGNQAVGVGIGAPYLSVRIIYRVDGPRAGVPHIQELAVFVEDMDALVDAVNDVDAAGHRIHGQTVHGVEVAGPGLMGRSAMVSPVHQE